MPEDDTGTQQHGVSNGLQRMGYRVVQPGLHRTHSDVMAGQRGGHRTQHDQKHQNKTLGFQTKGDQIGNEQFHCPVGFDSRRQLVLEVLKASMGLPAVGDRPLDGQADICRILFPGAQQGGHGVIDRGIRGQFGSHRSLNVPVRVTGGLDRIEAQLVIAIPELFAPTQHLVMDITAGGEDDHRQQQHKGRQRRKPLQPATVKTALRHN